MADGHRALLFVWRIVVTAVVLRQRYGLLRRRAVATALVGAGTALALLAGLALAMFGALLALRMPALSREKPLHEVDAR